MNEEFITLEKTVDYMLSDDYKKRFIAEYWQVRIRYEKLKSMLDAWNNNKLDFEPTCPKPIYDMQLKAMYEYLTVLETRANLEQVEL